MRAIGRDPVFIERGHGAEIVDVDGNHYVDYVCSWGPLIHGHAHPAVVAAVVAAAERGTTFGAPTAGRGRPGRRDRPADAVGRDGAHDLVGDRGDDERDPPGPRRDRAREDPEVRRRLPRPRRRPARPGRLGPGHRGDPGQPRRPGGRHRRDGGRALERRRGRAARHRGARARRHPGRAVRGQHGPRRRRPTASSTCCASARAPPAPCSSSTRSSRASGWRAAAPRSSRASRPT